MCTVVILRRPDHDWPVILGANRDEQLDRPWRPPARHWPDQPDVVAGLDELGGGTWMGVNDTGVAACILNRRGTLGPQAGKRSRGEIVLDALGHEDAVAAAESLAHLEGSAFRDFNLVLVDNRDAFWLRLDTDRSDRIEVMDIPEDLSMLTAGDLNDSTSPRVQHFRPQFEAADTPDPETGEWSVWQTLMAAPAPDGSARGAMCFRMDSGFGTSSSALLALPSVDKTYASPPERLRWLFAGGPPNASPYTPVDM